MAALTAEAIQSAAKRLVEFVNASPSPYHVVQECRSRLVQAGFKELSEREAKWTVQKGEKYFLTRNQSCILAFTVGQKWTSNSGFTLLGAHTDSPCLKVKPVSKRTKGGFLQVGVECYGGGIWNTWFDRDLTVAGRAITRSGGGLQHQLVRIQRPILNVPNLCIHLRKERSLFDPNKETEIVPVLATEAAFKLNAPLSSVESKDEGAGKTQQADKHHSLFVDMICKELGCQPADLLDFELMLADTQPATIGGALNEFIFAPRLDNLFNTFCALEALIESGGLDTESNVRMIALFDNEEVGSGSAQGAESKLTEFVMKRIVQDISGGASGFEVAVRNSYCLSADQAHAVHPNYMDRHEDNHKPAFHGGPVIKFNSNQRYATTAITASLLRVIADKCGVPLQDVCVRNDSPCGSTIGPILAAKLGMRTLDIGGPMLSMHSIRETCCTTSVAQSLLLFKTYFEEFAKVDATLQME